MNKNDLIANVAKTLDTPKKAAAESTDAVIEAISEALIAGEEVRIAGFGIFGVSERAARQGRNPQDGSTITIPASKNAKFKGSKQLKDALNK